MSSKIGLTHDCPFVPSAYRFLELNEERARLSGCHHLSFFLWFEFPSPIFSRPETASCLLNSNLTILLATPSHLLTSSQFLNCGSWSTSAAILTLIEMESKHDQVLFFFLVAIPPLPQPLICNLLLSEQFYTHMHTSIYPLTQYWFLWFEAYKIKGIFYREPDERVCLWVRHSHLQLLLSWRCLCVSAWLECTEDNDISNWMKL